MKRPNAVVHYLVLIFMAIGQITSRVAHQQVDRTAVLKRSPPQPQSPPQKSGLSPSERDILNKHSFDEHALRPQRSGNEEDPTYKDYRAPVFRQKPIPLARISRKLDDSYEREDLADDRTYLSEGPRYVRHDLVRIEELDLEERDVSKVTVETLVVVDTSFTKQFSSEKAMHEYLSIYWNDVALRFSSIPKPKIVIELVGVVSLTASDEKFFILGGDGTVNFDKTLKNFGEWVATHKSLPPHDFAYLMIGRELTGDVAGFAYEGAICEGDGKMSYSTGIGEDIGGHYDTTGLAVHEIGHNLGSAHDGSADSKKCSANDGNIMTPAPDLLQNPKSLYFSDCSIQSMYKNLQKDSAKCLQKKSAPKSKFPTSKKLPGEIPKVLDQFCELYVAGLDVFKFVAQGDCKKVRCAAPGYDDAESKLLAPDGAPCGGSKKCLFGKCQ